MCEVRANNQELADTVAELYSQELLKDHSCIEIAEQIDGLETVLYFDLDGNPVAASSVSLEFSLAGDVALEYLAVDRANRGLGYGRAIIDLLKDEHLFAGGSASALTVIATPSAVEYYISLGAQEDDSGRLFFPREDYQDPTPIEETLDRFSADTDEPEGWQEFLDDEDLDLALLKPRPPIRTNKTSHYEPEDYILDIYGV